MGKLVSIVTTLLVVLRVKALCFIKYFSMDSNWVLTIHNYNYEISGVILIIYTVGG